MMWCETSGADLKIRLQDYITYFEGTCEFCLSHLGIQQYLDEIEDHLAEVDSYDAETALLLYYDLGVIKFKLEALDEALEAWCNAEKYALELNDELFLAKIKSYKAIYYYASKDIAESKKNFDEATEIFKKLNRNDELALHYVNILWYKRYDENKEEVMQYLDEAFRYVQKSSSARDARVYLHLGYIYKTIFNDFMRGVAYLVKARELCNQNGNVEMESMTMHVLADGYMELGHNEEAMTIYKTLQNETRYRNITANLKCMILSTKAVALLRMGKFDLAMDAMDELRDYIDEAQVNIREAFECIHDWLMAAYLIFDEEDMEDVPELLEEAMSIYRRHAENFPLAAFEYHLTKTYADYYMALGDLSKAAEAYEHQVELAEGPIHEKKARLNLAHAYEEMGETAKAEKQHQLAEECLSEEEQKELIEQYDALFLDFQKYVKKQRAEENSGLPGRDSLGEFLQKRGLFGKTGLIRLDIDHFRLYNGNYGYTEGLNCIKKIANIIKEKLDPEKIQAFHFGGEQFVVAYKGSDEQKTKDLAEDILEAVREARILNNASTNSPYVTLSAGYTMLGAKENISTAMERAEAATVLARKRGHNRVEYQE